MTLEPTASSNQEPNYAEFYRCLLQIGPHALTGVEDWMVDWLGDEGTCSELLWLEGMQETFHDTWGVSPELAVHEAHDGYIQAVQTALLALPISPGDGGWSICPVTGQLLDWAESARQIGGSLNEDQVRRLLAAAKSLRSNPAPHLRLVT